MYGKTDKAHQGKLWDSTGKSDAEDLLELRRPDGMNAEVTGDGVTDGIKKFTI